ncbi:MAG: lysylphosphatidylglycerol synthase transmembrane domain-containing protein [Candidatus Omnitrophica bacterium]|nr:lysylphosphatidylglycerol synthase transmembrane domain-containing protein [Candidatus Omnitrophota bacterium]
MVNNKSSFLLKFIISFGLLLLLVWIMRKDAGEVIEILKNSNKFFIMLSVAVNILISIGFACRLRMLLSGKKIMLSIRDAVRLTFIGYFYNNFLPTTIGGDIAKAYYASKKTNDKAASYAAVFMDRILGLVSTLIIALIGLIFIGKDMDNKFIVWSVPFLCFLAASMIVFLFKKNNKTADDSSDKKGIFNNVKAKASKLYTAINLYRNNPVLLIKVVILSFILQSLSIATIYMFALSVGGDISLLKLFFIIPLVWTISMLPSLNGLGVREGAFVYFLKGYIGAEKAFAISVLCLGLIMFSSLAGGIFQLAYPIKIKGDHVND